MVQVGFEGMPSMPLRFRLSTPRFVDAGWDILPECNAACSGLATELLIAEDCVLFKLKAP